MESPAQLVGIHLAEPLQHHLAAILAFAEHVRTDIFERISRNSGPLRQLVEHCHRDVELADGTQRSRQPPDFALGLPRLRTLRTAGQNRNGFAKSARRNARLVDAVIVTLDGGRQKSLQCTRASFQQRGRYTGLNTVRGRMAANPPLRLHAQRSVREYITGMYQHKATAGLRTLPHANRRH